MEPSSHVPPTERREVRLVRVRAYLLEVAGATRSDRANRHLANLLALTAGVLNSVGFVAVSVYTSHMTGLTASVADHLVLGSYTVVGVGLLAIGSFVGGAMICAVLFNWGRRRDLRGRYANVLVLEALLILVFGGAADLLVWRHRTWVFVAVLSFTMGLQNAIITKISRAQIRTTHVTGMVTDIGIELGKLVYRSRRPGLDPVRADLAKLSMLAVLVGLFFGGGVLGAAGYLQIGFPVLLAPALVLLVAALPPLVADLRGAVR
ncbi:MAG: YoaK family protein [Pedococcus sp.]